MIAPTTAGSALVPKRKPEKPQEWVLKDNRNWRLGKLHMMFDNEKLSDIKLRPNIIVPQDNTEEDDGREFYYAQRAYLCAWSPVFDSIFYGEVPAQFKEAAGGVENGEVILECTKDILYLFLK